MYKSNTIMLDAGHFAKCNQSPLVPEYWESEMTWKLHLLLKKELEEYGFIVGTTREDQTKDLDVVERGHKAKGYEIFISLHSNACGNPEDWYEGSPSERVDRPVIYVPYTQPSECVQLASWIGEGIKDIMEVSPYQIATRQGSHGEWYGVMRGAAEVGCPMYFIIEHSFHTNKRAATWLLDKEEKNLQLLAEMEAAAIARYAGLEKQETYLVGDVNGDGKINAVDYAMLKRIVLGTYRIKDDRMKQRADVNGDGKINSTDYAMLKRMVLGTYELPEDQKVRYYK